MFLLVHISCEELRLGSETCLATYRHSLPSPGVVRGRGVRGYGWTRRRICGQGVSHAVKQQDDGLPTRLTPSRGVYFVVGMRCGRG